MWGWSTFPQTVPRNQGEIMTQSRVLRGAIAALAATGLVTGAIMAPAKAATRTTVVIVESNAFTSLNPSQADSNLVINGDIAYLTSMGFNYYNDKFQLVRNTKFGTYKILSQSPFKVEWHVNPGRVWSDGTPITAHDLLLNQMTASSAYSKAAGLGDPANTDITPAFNSLGYTGLYDTQVTNVSITPDRLGVVLTYKSANADYELIGPSVFPVHTLVAMAAGEKKLGTPAHNVALKNKFLTAYTTKDTATLKKYGKIWSESYLVNSVDAKTNPLLLVGNGAYQVDSAVKDQRVTLVLNPRYNSGEPTSGITKIVMNTITDGPAGIQALANGEVDVWAGQATADGKAALSKIAGVSVKGYATLSYEHTDVRMGDGPGEKDKYTGIFAPGTTAASQAQAKDLRTAYFLAFPREEIVEKVWKPIGDASAAWDSLNYPPSSPSYAKMIAANGSAMYREGTQASRTAAALALVKKYYPTTSADKPTAKVRILWGQPSNTRRISEAAIIKAGLAKAGFDADVTPVSGWSAHISENKYDAMFGGYGISAVLQKGLTDNWQSGIGQDMGYSNDKVDAAILALSGAKLSDDKVFANYLAVEKEVYGDAASMNITMWPGVSAAVNTLQNFKPSPLTPEVLWNFWEWKF